MNLTKAMLFISFFFLTSCTVGPNYKRPPVKMTAYFKEAPIPKDWKIAAPQKISYGRAWWLVFNDETLNHLVNQLNRNNQNIITAYHRYQQACALVAESAAGFFPTLTGTASVQRQNGGGSSSNNIDLIDINDDDATIVSSNSSGSGVRTTNRISFNAAWELDIWGAVRRAVEASKANAEANLALLAATRLSMQASLAQLYFQLRGIDAAQRLLNETVASYERSLKLTQNQYAAGIVARADIIQAQASLESAQSQAINNGILRAQYEHAIAVLTGMPPAAITICVHDKEVQPPNIPVSIPSLLLERRPDIAQAERLMAQANAQIGVAIATYFPSIQLTADITGGGTGLTRWWSLPMTAWSYGGQLTQLILDGGARRARVAAAKANYRATVSSYRQIVLTAFQDVEDNLSRLRILNNQIIVQHAAAQHARRALDIANNQYKAGTVPYINVLIAQVQALNAERNEIDINYQRMVAAVALIRAIGGCWV
jgi:NodT family efflux transporter outer membrane factor (OMF) lipoprotein